MKLNEVFSYDQNNVQIYNNKDVDLFAKNFVNIAL